MNQRILVLAGLLGLVVLALGGIADRALVRQARSVDAAAISEAEESVRLAALSIRAALAKHELAILADTPLSGIDLVRVLMPSHGPVPHGGLRPYYDRPTSELLGLIDRSHAVTAQGLPEAVVASLALGTREAKRAAAKRLLSGELPVRTDDLTYLGRVLEIDDNEVDALARRLRAVPATEILPSVPEFRRSFSELETVDGWSRQGNIGLGYQISISELLEQARISASVRPVSSTPDIAKRSRHPVSLVPDIEGLALEIAPEMPRRWPVQTLRSFLWAAVVVLLAGLSLVIRAVSRQAAAVERERTFLSSVTHELRTPLASLRLFGETLARGRGDPREYGELVAQESRRLESLVERVLAVTRMEATPSFARVRPYEIVDSVVELMRAAAERKGVTLQWRQGEEDQASLEAHWDEEAVRQALMNLLDNAIKHGKRGGRVEVGLDAEDGSLALSVTDDGPGVPRRDRKRIFARFQRGETSSSGTGLGLFLVERVAQAHGGRVDLVTERGQGSTFALVLPLEPDIGEQLA